MSRLCIVVNNNKPDYFGAALGGWCTTFALRNLLAVFVGSERRKEEIILLLTFRRNISSSDIKPTEVRDFQILMLLGE